MTTVDHIVGRSAGSPPLSGLLFCFRIVPAFWEKALLAGPLHPTMIDQETL